MDKGRASINDMYADLSNLGAIFSVQDRAKDLIDGYKADLESIIGSLETGDPLRVFVYDSGEDAALTAGLYAMPTAMIEAAGGMNVTETFEKAGAR